ncbi:hypothetical protein DCC77_05015 [Candidatus Uhrbacteria bacterium]|nr:MAG: hypothetical protein DCC77_05015 [Candidatus Uhrbacteria bacterium]
MTMNMTARRRKHLTSVCRFWCIHTAHWILAAVFIFMTFGLLYVLFAQDSALVFQDLGSP